MAAASSSKTTSLVTCRLYRNLLRTSKHFTAPAPEASVLTSLLHRTGIDDHIKDWNAFVAQDTNRPKSNDGMSIHDRARDLSQSYGTTTTTTTTTTEKTPSNRTHQRLFRRLLREVVTGTDNYGKMVFPSQVDTTRLRTIIQREFRVTNNNNDENDNSNANASTHFDDETRRQVAFCALRELNKKLSYYDWLNENNPEPIPQQAARRVSALPIHPPSSYLRPGVFLISHPYMNDSYFSKTVICILEHKGLSDLLEERRGTGKSEEKTTTEDNDEDDTDGDSTTSQREPRYITTPPGQTYGVIVNRVSVRTETGENRTLKEVFREHMLPERMAEVFGDSVVREGGPVHVALQMIHSLSSSELQSDDDLASEIGGTAIPAVYDENNDDETAAALCSDKATYFRGNLFKVMSQVDDGKMDRDDVTFFVGASTWSPGQLATEIAQGFWIPCRGPPEMALDGICEHEPTSSGNRPLADLWLSMMSACGDDEAKLSHLFHNDHWDENGMPCDASFEDDDDDDDSIVVF